MTDKEGRMHTVTTECEQAPEAALPGGYRLILAGPVMPGDECGYAHRILTAQSSNDIATWDAAYPDEGGKPYCYSGHYYRADPDGLRAAAADFDERVTRGY